MERKRMAHWIRYEQQGRAGFGVLENGSIRIHTGDMFAGAQATGATVSLAAVKVLIRRSRAKWWRCGTIFTHSQRSWATRSRPSPVLPQGQQLFSRTRRDHPRPGFLFRKVV